MSDDLTPDQAIEKLRALPEDKQRAVLMRLRPDERKGILGKLQVKGKTAPAPRGGPAADIEDEQARYQQAGPIYRGASSFQSGFGIPRNVQEKPTEALRGVAIAARHPGLEWDSLKDMWNGMDASQQDVIDRAYFMQHEPGVKNKAIGFALGVYSAIPIFGPAIVHALDQWNSGDKAGGAGSLASILTQAAAPKVGEEIAKLPGKLPATAESVRQFTQGLVGTGKKAVEEHVRTKAQAADVRATRVAEQNTKIALDNADASAQAQSPVLDQKAHSEALTRRGVAEKQLGEESSKFQAAVETAREKALKVGNEKYSAVNEKLNLHAGDSAALTDALHDSLSRISGTDVQPTILKSISDRLAEENGISYSDLQGYYSELGRELSRGTLPGDVYSAYDAMHDAIGQQMQEIADANGAGEQLTDARAYWKRMKQTFGRGPSATDVASQTLKDIAPEYMERQARDNRLRNLGYFDSTIPQTAAEIDRLRETLKGPAPKAPSGPTVPATKPLKAVETPEFNTRKVRETLLRKWAAAGEKISPWRMHILLGGGLASIFTALYSPGAAAAEAGFAVSSALGPAAVARLVERPAIREWLTRPPADELAALKSLPHADRVRIVDTLNKVAQSSQGSGRPIVVSPKLAVLGIAASSHQPAPRRHPSDEYADPANLQ